MLLYEAGEGLRFDEVSVRAGLDGILNVMRELGIMRVSRKRSREAVPFVARSSTWIRAHESGLLRILVTLGARVSRGDVLGYISDPYSGTKHPVKAYMQGVVIGRVQIPSAHEGEALFHIARFRDDHEEIADEVDAFQ